MTELELNTGLSDLYPQVSPEAEAIRIDSKDRRVERRTPCNDLAYMVWIDEEGSRQWERVQIVNKSKSGVGLESAKSFPVGKMVWIEVGGGLCRAAVRFVKKRGDRYRIGLLRIVVDRRRCDREPIVGTGTLQFSGLSTPAIIRNISPNGAQIETAVEVPVSEVVRLTGTSLECLGITRYCRVQETQYLIGLEILRPLVESAQGPAA